MWVNLMIDLLQLLYKKNASKVDFDKIPNMNLNDIELFSIAPQIYFLLKKNNLFNDISLQSKKSIKEQYKRRFFQNLVVKQETDKALSAFEEYKLKVIPLKGTLFAETYFGHFSARVTSDIDLLVHPNDIEKAKELIIKIGYVPNEIETDHFHICFKKKLTDSMFISLELHWNLMKENTSDINIETFWFNAIPLENYQFVKMFSTQHTFYFICLHGARHRMQEVKYLLDIVQMLFYFGNYIDYIELFKQAKQDRTLKKLIMALSVVYRQFPDLYTIKPFHPNVLSMIWSYKEMRKIAIGDIHSVYNHIYEFIFKVTLNDTWNHRVISLKEWFFPELKDNSLFSKYIFYLVRRRINTFRKLFSRKTGNNI